MKHLEPWYRSGPRPLVAGIGKRAKEKVSCPECKAKPGHSCIGQPWMSNPQGQKVASHRARRELLGVVETFEILSALSHDENIGGST